MNESSSHKINGMSKNFISLESLLVNFRVLSQLSPGDIVMVDERGTWSLTQASSFKSGLRSIFAFLSGKHIRPQREMFLESAQQTLESIITNAQKMMKSSVFMKCIDLQNGILSRKIMEHSKLTIHELEEFETIMQKLQLICIHLYESLKGLHIMKTNPPYHTDKTFCSQIDVLLIGTISQILDNIFRKIGPDFQIQVFNVNFVNYSSSAEKEKEKNVAFPTQIDKNGKLFWSGSTTSTHINTNVKFNVPLSTSTVNGPAHSPSHVNHAIPLKNSVPTNLPTTSPRTQIDDNKSKGTGITKSMSTSHFTSDQTKK